MLRIETIAAWLLTYAVHSTLLLGIAWVLTKRLVQSHSTRDLIWKTALVGGLVSSTVQFAAGVRPVAGQFSIAATASGTDRRTDGQTGTRWSQPPVQTSSPEPSQSPEAQTKREAASDYASVRPSVRLSVFSRIGPTALLLTAWAIVALLLAAQFLVAQFFLVIRVGRRALVRDEQLLEVLDVLREEAGIRRHVRLTRAEGLPSPVALGMSEICIPDAALTELDREQQESMLAHELAHLARRDPVWLVVGCLIERVFFFQPLNRLARRRIQEAAEYLCDDWAVRRSGSGLTLAKCLVKVAEWIDTTPEPVPVSGMAEMRSHFVSRIHRLIANHAMSAQPARRWLAPVAFGVLAVIVAAAPGVTATRNAEASWTDRRTDGQTDQKQTDRRTDGRTDQKQADGRTDGETDTALAVSQPQEFVSRLEQGTDTHIQTRTQTETRTRTESHTQTELSVRPSVRLSVQSVEAMMQGRDTSAVTALIAALKDEDPDVRRAAAQALGNRRDPRAVPALIAVMSDKDAEVRARAIEALSNIRDPRAADGFIIALKDENAEVRAKAAEALGELPETRRGYSSEAQRASTALAALLSDISAEVRRAAIQALKEVKGARPTEALITALKDADADVRQSAAEALGDLQARNATQQLSTLLNDPNADVRHAAAHALGHLKDPATAEALAKALKDANSDVRQAAAEALGELELTQAPQALLDAMHDENPDVRHATIEAVSNIRDPRAVPALAALINDPDGDVREMAVEALSNIRDAAAIDALIKAMQSKDPNVRKAAAEALGERN